MDRNYSSADNFNRSNQTTLMSFSTVSNSPVSRQTKTPSAGIFDQPLKNKILNELSKETLENVLSSAKAVYLEHSASIYRPDEAVRFVYFPETAVFSEFITQADGKMIEIAMTGRDGITGISSLFNDCPARNFTQVLHSGYALQISAEFLINKLNNEAEIRKPIFDYLNCFINHISQKVVCNGFHLTENRLCSWLLMLQERVGDGILNLTHEQIALSLGVHRPSVTQIMKKLREEKMIDYLRGKISIPDRAKTKAAACSCYLPLL